MNRKNSNKKLSCTKHTKLPHATIYGKTNAYLEKITEITKKTFPKSGYGGREAFNIVRKRLFGDKEPNRNFITFVNTAADMYQDQIHCDTKNINFIDTHPYVKVKEIEQQMVHMMGNLYNDKNYSKCNGISTVGSSEAIYISILLHKFKWEERYSKNALDKTNMIWSFNTHINWDKAARWNYIQEKKIPAKHLNYNFGAKEVSNLINKNTIAVICTLGTTRSCTNDNVEEINDFLKEYHKKTGHFIPIHVDAAIGGFVVPFLKPELKWSFELNHVKSINVSFHKYGGTYAGMGMLLVKSDYCLPEKFNFCFNAEHMSLHDSPKRANPTNKNNPCHYPPPPHSMPNSFKMEKNKKQGHFDDWQINFSKPASQIAEAFYLFMKLGKQGYEKRLRKCLNTSMIIDKYLSSIENKERKKIFLKVSENYYPVLAYYLNDICFPLKNVLERLEKENGYCIPAYTMGDTDDIIFRLVFKPNVTHAEARKLKDAFEVVINNYL